MYSPATTFPAGPPARGISQRWRRRIFRSLAVVVLLGLIASWIVAGLLVSPASQEIGAPPAVFRAESISLASDSGSTIRGWHHRAAQPKGVVVLLHGMRGNRLTMLARARFLRAAAYSIVMIDLQAHGESTGQNVTLGHLEQHDVKAAVEFARQEHPREAIAVIGVSLGGASAVMASPLGIDALVLEAVFPNISVAIQNRVAEQLGVLSTIPAELLLVQLQPRLGVSRSDIRPIDNLSNIDCPLLIISGTADLHTTVDETQEMFSIAKQPKELWLIDGAAHVDLHQYISERYEARLLKFLQQHL
jgi:alpha-beta hydrolase superfamily lysophospholipase